MGAAKQLPWRMGLPHSQGFQDSRFTGESGCWLAPYPLRLTLISVITDRVTVCSLYYMIYAIKKLQHGIYLELVCVSTVVQHRSRQLATDLCQHR